MDTIKYYKQYWTHELGYKYYREHSNGYKEYYDNVFDEWIESSYEATDKILPNFIPVSDTEMVIAMLKIDGDK